MKKHLLFSFALSLIVFVSACSKDNSTVSIVYTVKQTSTTGGTFTVNYTSDGGITKTEGPLSNANWNSLTYKKRIGDFVAFKIQSHSSQATFIARLYKNGELFGEVPVDFAAGQVEISGVITE